MESTSVISSKEPVTIREQGVMLPSPAGNFYPMTAEDVKAQIDRIQDIMRTVMQEGVHYGSIPGTGNRKALLQPGAQKLLFTFHIGQQFVVEDLSTPGSEYRYRVKAMAFHLGTGKILGEGLGECSSNEEKFRWRECGQKEFAATDPKFKRIKYSGYFDRQRNVYVENETTQVRVQPVDKANTCLKISKKRAIVDMTFNVLACGDIFFNGEGGNGPPPEQNGNQRKPYQNRAKPNPTQPNPKPAHSQAPTAGDGTTLNENQVSLIRSKLGPVSEVDLVLNFQVACLDEIPAAKINEVLAWIKQKAMEAMNE